MKALIIEDVSVFQRFLHRVISKYGSCDTAGNAKEGMSAFIQAHQNNEPYDIIFLDIMMPGMNGIELLKKIRAVDTGADRVKIIMATTIADNNIVQEAMQIGCDGYIVKPFKMHEVEEQLVKLLLIKNP